MPAFLIKHRGFFEQTQLMSTINDWLGDLRYYSNIVFKQSGGGPSGKNYYIEITGDRKVSEYVKFHIKLLGKLDGVKDVEIIKEGKKIKTNEGHVHIDILPTLEIDWQARFDGNKFLKALGDFLENYILKYKISDYWVSMIVGEMTGLAEKIKQTLGQEV